MLECPTCTRLWARCPPDQTTEEWRPVPSATTSRSRSDSLTVGHRCQSPGAEPRGFGLHRHHIRTRSKVPRGEKRMTLTADCGRTVDQSDPISRDGVVGALSTTLRTRYGPFGSTKTRLLGRDAECAALE